MKKNTTLTLAATLAMAIAMTPASFSQGLVIEPDSIDFGTVQVGLTGLAESYHELTITNQSDVTLEIQLQTSNLPEPESIQLFSPPAVSIHPILRRIANAVSSFRHDHQEDASSVFELWEGGYLEIEEEYLWRWQFELIGQDPITQIEAVGDGIHALFDCQTQQFTSYTDEFEQSEPVRTFRLSRGHSRTFAVSFAPRESYEMAGWVSFIWGDQQVRLFVSGRSDFRNTLALSNNSLDFGEIYLDRTVVRPLTVHNTSGLSADINFECSNPDEFYIFGEWVEGAHDFILATDRAIDRFVTDHGDSPTSVEELLELSYLLIDEQLGREWSFSLIGSDPVTQIEAVSTAEYPHGAGHVILLDKQTGRFDGHRFFDLQGGENAFVGVNRSIDLRVAFRPSAVGDAEDRLLIRSHNQERWDVFETYEVRLSGSGLSVTTDKGNGVLPSSLSLNPPFPNPFNSTAIVSFQTPFAGEATLSLVDMNGRTIRSWIAARPSAPAPSGTMNAGSGAFKFAVNADGLAAGTYWVRVDQAGHSAQQRVVLVR